MIAPAAMARLAADAYFDKRPAIESRLVSLALPARLTREEPLAVG